MSLTLQMLGPTAVGYPHVAFGAERVRSQVDISTSPEELHGTNLDIPGGLVK